MLVELLIKFCSVPQLITALRAKHPHEEIFMVDPSTDNKREIIQRINRLYQNHK